jgi:hypothetical protein
MKDATALLTGDWLGQPLSSLKLSKYFAFHKNNVRDVDDVLPSCNGQKPVPTRVMRSARMSHNISVAFLDNNRDSASHLAATKTRLQFLTPLDGRKGAKLF